MESFDVVLAGFVSSEAQSRAVPALQRAFGVDAQAAARVIANLPFTVKRGATAQDAERYFHALRDIGAEVELRRIAPAPTAEATVEATAEPSPAPAVESAAAPAQPAPSPPPPASAVEPAAVPAPEPSATAHNVSAADAPVVGVSAQPPMGPDPASDPDANPLPPVEGIVQVPSATRRTAAAIAAMEGGAEPSVLVTQNAEPQKSADERSFWQALPSTVMLPFHGSGLRWLMWTTSYGAMLLVVSFGSQFLGIFGLIIFAAFLAVMLGLVASYYRACLWGVLANEGEPDNMKEVDPTVIVHDYFRTGLLLVGFMAVSQLTYAIWIYGQIKSGTSPVMILVNPLGWLLLVGPMLYWPMGLGLMAVTSSPFSFWDVARGLRVMVGAPLEFLALTVLGGLAYIMPWIGFVVLVTLSGSWFMLLLAPFLTGMPLAYSHAVQGALMGHLFRTRPELLDDKE